MAKGMGDAYVAAFYGAFERHIPDECGKGINYFFSDELQFDARGNLWCDDFKEEFIKRKGNDMREIRLWIIIHNLISFFGSLMAISPFLL